MESVEGIDRKAVFELLSVTIFDVASDAARKKRLKIYQWPHERSDFRTSFAISPTE